MSNDSRLRYSFQMKPMINFTATPKKEAA